MANLVKEANLHELEIEWENTRLKILNQEGFLCSAPTIHAQKSSSPTIVREDKILQVANSENNINYHMRKSPIVGTF
jgi:hypothetical protein